MDLLIETSFQQLLQQTSHSEVYYHCYIGVVEMGVIRFIDDTMVFGKTRRSFICGVIDLNSDLWLDKFEL